MKRLDGFGNGRDAVRLWEELLQCRAQRVFDLPEEVRTITAKDAAMAGESILAARRPPDGPLLSQSSMPSNDWMCRTPEQLPDTLQPTDIGQFEWQEPEEVLTEEKLEMTEDVDVEKVVEVEAQEDSDLVKDKNTTDEERDVGFSDEDWEELECAKNDYAAHLDALRRGREEAKLEEERRRAEAIQEKIRRICPCPAGYQWSKCSGGWRCRGGSHFVSDAQLNSQFTV